METTEMTDAELDEFARDKARQIANRLADCVGKRRAAEMLVRTGIEDLLCDNDRTVVAAIFEEWADSLKTKTGLH